VQPLESPDSHQLRAAIGWLELGNPQEAAAELDRLGPEARSHPDALDVRWQIHAAARNWDACLEVAQKLVQQHPSRASGWIHRAYALRRATGGSLEAAMNALLPASKEFPDLPLIPYNLACYCCQLQRLPEARQWLSHAFEIAEQLGEKPGLRRVALNDPDLETLWPELKDLK
jgi:predicted Zn-dependent protease